MRRKISIVILAGIFIASFILQVEASFYERKTIQDMQIEADTGKQSNSRNDVQREEWSNIQGEEKPEHQSDKQTEVSTNQSSDIQTEVQTERPLETIPETELVKESNALEESEKTNGKKDDIHYTEEELRKTEANPSKEAVIPEADFSKINNFNDLILFTYEMNDLEFYDWMNALTEEEQVQWHDTIKRYDIEASISKRYEYIDKVIAEASATATLPQLRTKMLADEILSTAPELKNASVPDGKTLRTLLESSKNQGTLNITADVNFGGSVTINNNCTLTGKQLRATYTDQFKHFITIAPNKTVTISNTIVMKAGMRVGGIDVPNKATLNLNGTVDGFYITHSGGGVRVLAGGKMNMSGTIKNCIAGMVGGGIENYGTVAMTGGTIVNCQALCINDVLDVAKGGGGGAIATSGTFTMSGGELKNCYAYYLGGAVKNTGKMTLSGGSIHDNKADKSGGGICSGPIESAALTITGGSIFNNQATGVVAIDDGGGDGGGMKIYGPGSITGASIYGNKAMRGAGIYTRNTLTIDGDGVDIHSNQSSIQGGGVYVFSGKTIFKRGKIHDNKVVGSGAGFYNKGKIEMSGGFVYNNHATDKAGALYNDGFAFINNMAPTFTMTGGRIYGNSAGVGGAGLFQCGTNTPIMTLTGGMIYGNTTGGYGIYNATPGAIVNISNNLGLGYSAWTDAEHYTISNNTNGNIFNNGTMTITGTNLGQVCMAGNGPSNIYNQGILTVQLAAGGNPPVLSGAVENGIRNTGRLAYNGGMILLAKNGILNEANGTVTAGGGEIYKCTVHGINNAGTFTMTGTDVHHNTTVASGAGVFNTKQFTMSGGTIRNNSGAAQGGGAGVENSGGTFLLNSGNIKDNVCGRLGGGIRNDGTFQMKGGTISGNTAAASGGGIFSGRDNSVTISGGVITNNQSTTGNGGGICLDNNTKGTHVINNTSITNNSANGNGSTGGGIYSIGTLSLTNNTISGNRAGSGGGIFFGGTGNTFNSGIVEKNTAVNYGGGIQLMNGQSLQFNGGALRGNIAPELRGGGINSDGTLTMTGGEVSGNTGSGIRVGDAVSAFHISNGMIHGNTGYGIYNVLGSVNIKNVSSTQEGWTLIGFKKFANAWKGLEGAKSDSNQNTVGAIYNQGILNISGSSRIYSGTEYGIKNEGVMTMKKDASCTLFGDATYGIHNGKKGNFTMLGGNQVWLAKTGLWNEGTAVMDGGTITENTVKGIRNDGTLNLYGGIVTANGNRITLKWFPAGTKVDPKATGNGIYQNGVLNVKKAPAVGEDIFLTANHFITVVETCTVPFITSMTKADTFNGRVIANYKFSTFGQTKRYSLEADTQGYAVEKGIDIADTEPESGIYPYQVLLEGERVLIQYNGNPAKGDENKITGSVQSDIVPINALYTIRENGFSYQRHSYTGWGDDQRGFAKMFQPGNQIVPESGLKDNLIPIFPLGMFRMKTKNQISVRSLVEEKGEPVSLSESMEGVKYKVDLYAIWDEAPTIDTVAIEFYEGEKVLGKQLKNSLYFSELGATDYEDGVSQKGKKYFPHLLDDKTSIRKVTYKPLQNGNIPSPSYVNFATDVPGDTFYLDTFKEKGMAEDEVVVNKITFHVEDSRGNMTEQDGDVRINYNNFPTLKVPENLILTSEYLRAHPLTQSDLLKYAKANDVEDDAAKLQGIIYEGNPVNIQNKVIVLSVLDKNDNPIQPELINDVGDYFVNYSVTDRFGKETLKTLKLTSVDPVMITAEDIKYVRFISLKHLNTLDENSKWNKDELRAILQNKTTQKTYKFTLDQVLKIKEMMKGLRVKEDFENVIQEIIKKYF